MNGNHLFGNFAGKMVLFVYYEQNWILCDYCSLFVLFFQNEVGTIDTEIK